MFGPPRSSIYLPNSSNAASGSFTSSQTNHPTLYTNTAYLPFSGLQQQPGFGNFNTDNLAQFQQQQDVTASLQHILSQLPPATTSTVNTTTCGNAISMNPGIPGQSSFPQPQFSSFSTPLYGHHANQVSTGGFSDYSTGSFTGQIYPNSVDTFDPTDNASESASTYSSIPVDRKVRKSTREKARRTEINDRFEALCMMLNLSKKAEKSVVMESAISTITNLRNTVDELNGQIQVLRTGLGGRATSSQLISFQASTPPNLSNSFVMDGLCNSPNLDSQPVEAPNSMIPSLSQHQRVNSDVMMENSMSRGDTFDPNIPMFSAFPSSMNPLSESSRSGSFSRDFGYLMGSMGPDNNRNNSRLGSAIFQQPNPMNQNYYRHNSNAGTISFNPFGLEAMRDSSMLVSNNGIRPDSVKLPQNDPHTLASPTTANVTVGPRTFIPSPPAEPQTIFSPK